MIHLGPVLALILALSACGVASTVSDGTQSTLNSIFESGNARRARHAAEDDAKCQRYGFKPGTEAYGNCRLQAEQIRATKAAAAANDRPLKCRPDYAGGIECR